MCCFLYSGEREPVTDWLTDWLTVSEWVSVRFARCWGWLAPSWSWCLLSLLRSYSARAAVTCGDLQARRPLPPYLRCWRLHLGEPPPPPARPPPPPPPHTHTHTGRYEGCLWVLVSGKEPGKPSQVSSPRGGATLTAHPEYPSNIQHPRESSLPPLTYTQTCRCHYWSPVTTLIFFFFFGDQQHGLNYCRRVWLSLPSTDDSPIE